MSGPNPFSKSNAPEHNLVPKIITSQVFGTPQVVVDLVDIHTAYALQIGSSTNPVQLEYVNQLGTTGNPVIQEYVNYLGSTGTPVIQEYVTNIGDPFFPSEQMYVNKLGGPVVPVELAYIREIGGEFIRGDAFFNEATIGTLYCSNIIPPPAGGSGGIIYTGGTGIGVTYPSGSSGPGVISSLVRGGTGIGVTLGGDNYYVITNTGVQDIVGSPGIGINVFGDTYTILNTGVITVTAGTGIAVDSSNAQNPKISVTGQAGITGVSGGTGIQILNGTSQFPTIFTNNIQTVRPGTGVSITGDPLNPTINASGGGTGANPTGPQGEIVFFTPSGITSSFDLTYDGMTLYAPSLEIVKTAQPGIIGLATSGGDSSIFSGKLNLPNRGNYLNIGGFQDTPTMTVDTINRTVGIGVTGPTYAFDVAGQALITYNGNTAYEPLPGNSGTSGGCAVTFGNTYFIRAWGAGGAGNGGVGGAGGYTEVTYSPPVTGTVSWGNQYGSTGGGGAALVVGGPTVSTGSILYVPGGGAGGTGGGNGAAAGENSGTPIPEGGISGDGTGLASASYTADGAWAYNVAGSGLSLTPGYTFSEGSFGIPGATFTTGGSIGGTVATIPSGTTGKIAFSLVATQEVTLAGTTYQLQPGTQINIQGTFVFSGATFTSNPGTLNIPGNSLIEVTEYGPTAGGTGTVLFDPWLNTPGTTGSGGTTYTPSFTNVSAYLSAGLSVASTTVTLVTGPEGITLNSDDIGVTWQFVSNSLNETEANQRIEIGAGTTMIFPGFLTGITNCTISMIGTVTLPTGTELDVAQRTFRSYGATAGPSQRQSSGYGGGGYAAGGEPARVTYVPGITGPLLSSTNEPAGGGAGSWYIDVGATGITYGGIGPLPYTNEYNRYGIYGAGGTSGGTGGAGYLVIEQVITPATPIPALTVDGALEVTGPVNIVNNSSLTCGPIIASGFTSSGNLVLTGTAGLSMGTGDINTGGSITGNDVIATTSDVRSKHDIVTIDSALDKVLKMRGVYYSRNADNQRRVGVIAQEMECVLPEVVFTDNTDEKNKSVSYGNIVALLIEAIKEQQEMINQNNK